MIKNYLLITFRSMLRNKAFTSINTIGLALGISCSIIIFLWVRDEMSMDAFHANRDRLYRILENQFYSNGTVFTFAATPGPMAPVIKEKYPEIEYASRITWEERRLFTVGEKSFYEGGRFVDPDFLLMFSFDLMQGNNQTALNDNHSIVISEAMAKKFFGEVDPVGKIITLDNIENFTVSAVLREIPSNSSLKFDFLIPFQTYFKWNETWLGVWSNNNIRTNIMLKEGTDAVAFAEKLKFEIKAHTDQSNNIELHIQPYADAYLHGKFENGVLVGGRIEYVRIFFVVGILVLVIAGINFMNLTTAQSVRRAKEVGLRKTIGAVRNQLAIQFFSESMIMVVLSSVFALVLSMLLLPVFNEIADKKLSLGLLDGSSLWLVAGVILFTGLLSGCYPALYISGFQPSRVLKGQMASGAGASRFRKVLVVLQFSLSIILVISTVVIFRQMDFIKKKDIGLKREGLIYMYLQGDMTKHAETIRQTLLNNPAVESATLSSVNPIDIGNSTSNLEWEGKDPDAQILFSNFSADFEFVETMQMTMVEGRSFSREFPTDTSNFIINEAARSAMGFEQAAGQPITLWGDRKGKIVGVVKDFNFQSVHNKVEPMFMMLEPDWFNVIFVRHQEGKTQEAIQALEAINKQYAAAYPFNYNILETDWDNMYKTEDRVSKLFNYFSFLSICISCLGLFGLSAYSAEQRTKELGVRKVLGASVPGLMQLVAKEFVWLVLIASLIGCPTGWYLMNDWLSSYAYHVDIGLATLLLAAGLCLVISLLTVSYHAARVALTDPVRSLRYE